MNALVQQYLEMFADVSELKDDYDMLYERFGICFQLGVHIIEASLFAGMIRWPFRS